MRRLGSRNRERIAASRHKPRPGVPGGPGGPGGGAALGLRASRRGRSRGSRPSGGARRPERSSQRTAAGRRAAVSGPPPAVAGPLHGCRGLNGPRRRRSPSAEKVGGVATGGRLCRRPPAPRRPASESGSVITARHRVPRPCVATGESRKSQSPGHVTVTACAGPLGLQVACQWITRLQATSLWYARPCFDRIVTVTTT